jgi:SAM-dependent methyltransferase
MDWLAMAAPWLQVEAEMEASHRPVLDALMDKAALQRGQRVLDIGIGSGSSVLAAAEAVGPDGHVTGVDISPPFAARSAARAPANATIVNADAATHPFEPDSFDSAISLFGVMFFPDTVGAMTNIRRALRKGGTLTFASWATPHKNPWFGVPGKVASAVLGDAAPRDPHAPGPFAFADADRVLRMMEDAGWEASVDTVDLHLTPPGTVSAVAQLHTIIGAAAMRMNEAGVDVETRKRVHEGLVAAFAPWETADAVKVPAHIHFYTATAP